MPPATSTSTFEQSRVVFSAARTSSSDLQGKTRFATPLASVIESRCRFPTVVAQISGSVTNPTIFPSTATMGSKQRSLFSISTAISRSSLVRREASVLLFSFFLVFKLSYHSVWKSIAIPLLLMGFERERARPVPGIEAHFLREKNGRAVNALIGLR